MVFRIENTPANAKFALNTHASTLNTAQWAASNQTNQNVQGVSGRRQSGLHVDLLSAQVCLVHSILLV